MKKELSNFEKAQADKILSCYNNVGEDELEKGGEGSKGGKVIGHTKSGKAIYEETQTHIKNIINTNNTSIDSHRKEKGWGIYSHSNGELAKTVQSKLDKNLPVEDEHIDRIHYTSKKLDELKNMVGKIKNIGDKYKHSVSKDKHYPNFYLGTTKGSKGNYNHNITFRTEHDETNPSKDFENEVNNHVNLKHTGSWGDDRLKKEYRTGKRSE